MIKAVFFDLDDTLCDTSKSVAYALNMTHRMVEEAYPQLADFETWASVFKEMRSKETPPYPRSAITLREKRFTEVLETFGVRDAWMAKNLAHIYNEAMLKDIKLFPETMQVIEELKRRYILGIITNAPSDVQWLKIDRLKLRSHFKYIFLCSDIGFWKPQKEAFQTAIDRARIKPEDTAYIGNSVVEDMVGAKSCGMLSIWLNRSGGSPQISTDIDFEVRSLTDVIPLLDAKQHKPYAR